MNAKWRARAAQIAGLAGLYLAAAGAANAQTYYSNYLGNSTLAAAINQAGQVAGQTSYGGTAFLWSNGVMTTFGTGFTVNTLNDAGQLGGQLYNGSMYAAIWTSSKTTTLNALTSSAVGDVLGINKKGQAVGTSDNVAVIWKSGTKATALASLGGINSAATAINTSGTVVGWSDTNALYTTHAVVWNGTKATDLGTLGGRLSAANDINDAGVIAGYATLATTNGTAGYAHATTWRGTQATDLGTLGGFESRANAINSTGQVVGWSNYLTNNANMHATLWSGGKIVDLNSFLDTSLASDGWVLTTAIDINDAGWIVTQGYNSKYQQGGSFLLSTTAIGGYTPPPVPEPGTYALVLLGLGSAVAVARRQRQA